MPVGRAVKSAMIFRLVVIGLTLSSSLSFALFFEIVGTKITGIMDRERFF